MRKQFTPSQKSAVAMAALKGDKSINQIASDYQVHPTQVKKWRDKAKEALPGIFSASPTANSAAVASQAQIDELHRVIGVRDAELEWLKKKIHAFGS